MSVGVTTDQKQKQTND